MSRTRNPIEVRQSVAKKKLKKLKTMKLETAKGQNSTRLSKGQSSAAEVSIASRSLNRSTRPQEAKNLMKKLHNPNRCIREGYQRLKRKMTPR